MTVSIESLVQAMCLGFRSDRAEGLRVTYHLHLNGDQGGDWTVSVIDRKCQISAGRPGQPQASITMSSNHYRRLSAGHLDVRAAFQQRQIQVEGSLPLALKFAEIFPAWASLVETTPSPQPPLTPSPSPSPPPTPAPDPSPTPAPASPTLTDYVRTMPNGFRPDRAGGLEATYQFELADNGTWTVTVRNGVCSVSQVLIDSPDVVIRMTAEDFIQLAEGWLDTRQAVGQGRISISGDLNLAARITDIFGAWADTVSATPFPTPQPQPQPPPPLIDPPSAPSPTPSTPPSTVAAQLLNGSFDIYQPYFRKGEAKVWKEDRFPERYGMHWSLVTIREKSGRRFHLMDSGVFGKFTRHYFGGGGRDYHIHGRHSQVIASRYEFDLVFYQTVPAQPGRSYTFGGSLVSFFQGTSGPPVHNKVFKTIGLDPTGGQDYAADSVVWGERDGIDNAWRYPSLTVTAQGPALTVFIRIENTEEDVGQTELNIVHLDNFVLT